MRSAVTTASSMRIGCRGLRLGEGHDRFFRRRGLPRGLVRPRHPVAFIVVPILLVALGACHHDPPPSVNADPPRTPDPDTREVLGGGTYTPLPTPVSEESATKSGIPDAPGSKAPGNDAFGNDAPGIADPGNDAPGYALNGMVGQVNGKAIYAHDVLEPIDAQLAALGRQLPRYQFEREAADKIGIQLREIVSNALLYAEAQRDLTDNETLALQQMVQVRRAELLRLYGRGSVALAEQTLREEGTTLDKQLEDYRQGVVVFKLLREKLYPRINVTKRDIERYYDENRERFNPPATRTLRVIRVSDPDIAAKIAQRLEAGDPFEKLASSVVNQPSLAARGGRMAAVTGDVVFREDELNDAILQLEDGQYTPQPIYAGDEYWFIMLEQTDQPPVLSLKMAQLQIERILFVQQFDTLSQRYREGLLSNGSYAAPDQMGRQLLQIAVNRYAAAQ